MTFFNALRQCISPLGVSNAWITFLPIHSYFQISVPSNVPRSRTDDRGTQAHWRDCSEILIYHQWAGQTSPGGHYAHFFIALNCLNARVLLHIVNVNSIPLRLCELMPQKASHERRLTFKRRFEICLKRALAFLADDISTVRSDNSTAYYLNPSVFQALFRHFHQFWFDSISW